MRKHLILSAALILTYGCTAPGPDAPPSEHERFQQNVEETAEGVESTGSLLGPLTGGISVIVAGAVAEALRRWGKRQGARAVAEPIESARDHEAEAELKTKGMNVIVFKKFAASQGHEDNGVGRTIRKATN